MGDDTTTGNGRLDESVKLLVTTNGKLQMARGNALHTKIARRVAGKLKNLGSKILQNGSRVHGGSSTDTASTGNTGLQVPVDTANGELQASLGRARRGLLGGPLVAGDTLATRNSLATDLACLAAPGDRPDVDGTWPRVQRRNRAPGARCSGQARTARAGAQAPLYSRMERVCSIVYTWSGMLCPV